MVAVLRWTEPKSREFPSVDELRKRVRWTQTTIEVRPPQRITSVAQQRESLNNETPQTKHHMFPPVWLESVPSCRSVATV